MKKIILLISFLLTTLVVFSQVKTKDVNYLSKDQSYASCKGIVTADTLCATYDSIVFPFRVDASGLYKVNVGISLKYKLRANDTVSVCLYGKDFENDTYERIGTSGAFVKVASATSTYLEYKYGTAVQWRYIRVDLRSSGSYYHDGVYVNSVEIFTGKQ